MTRGFTGRKLFILLQLQPLSSVILRLSHLVVPFLLRSLVAHSEGGARLDG